MKKYISLSLILIFVLIAHQTYANVAISGGLTHENTAKPGDTYQGAITLTNLDEEPQDAKLYQTDYTFFADGRAIYGDPGSIERSNTSWITFSPSLVTIPPKGTSEIIYTVKVPLSKELIGTYWSMIMVEGIPKITPEEIDDGKPKVGVKTLIRYGIQMITHIQDTGTRRLKFLGTKLTKSEEERILQIDVENTGQRMLRPTIWCEIYDSKGTLVTRLEGKKARTYPGTSIRYNVRVVIKRQRFSLNKEQIEDAKFTELLDTSVMPDFIKRNFKDRLISIADDAVIQVEETGNKWVIFSGDDEYSIAKNGDKLEAFQHFDVPSGTYKALIIADCGDDYVFGAKYDLKIGE
jgi:hypothetical protein